MKVTIWGNTRSARDLMSEFEIHEIKYDTQKLNPSELRRLANIMRKNRDTLGLQKTTQPNRWNFDILTKFPILEVDDEVYPAWWLDAQNSDERWAFLHEIKKKQNDEITPLKLKIKYNPYRCKESVLISKESEAKINVTMLRVINGIDIYNVMKGWSEEEKAAGMIMWRLAQHNKGNEMRLIADMLITKAKIADPYYKETMDVNRQDNRA